MTATKRGGRTILVHGPSFYQLVAGALAVILLVDISVLWLTERQVPELLSVVVGAVVGFYFGTAPNRAPHNGGAGHESDDLDSAGDSNGDGERSGVATAERR